MTDASAPNESDADASALKSIFKRLEPGDRFPTLYQACEDFPKYAFHANAGRYQLFGFFLAADEPAIREALAEIEARRDLFDDRKVSFFGVSILPEDRRAYGLGGGAPGVQFIWDYDRTVSDACGATPLNASAGATGVARKWFWSTPRCTWRGSGRCAGRRSPR